MRPWGLGAALLWMGALNPPGARAQDQPAPAIPAEADTAPARSIAIPRVSRPPRLEDFLSGTPRQAETRITDFRQREPGDGKPVTERTSAYLSYDDNQLYVVFVCQDEPGKVRAHMVRREEISDDDQVSIYLDTFHDRHRAYVFTANPFGIQLDGILTEGKPVQGDDEDEEEVDYSFDTLWYSQGRVTDYGYVVWMAIPFKSLRFSNTPVQSWGIAVARVIYRKNETAFWPYITDRVDGFAQQMATVGGFEGIGSGRNIQLIPYGTFTDSHFLDQERPAFVKSEHGRGGLDAKAVLGNSLTLDVAANPDFSEVETNDPLITENQRFEVLFPEKRPFFLENSSFFQTPIPLFYSRRIADPEFGARLTGKVGAWSLGILGAADRAPGEEVDAGDPSYRQPTGIGIVSVERELGHQSYIGAMFTTRDFGSISNHILSLNSRFKLNPNWVLKAQMVRSFDRDALKNRLSGSAYYAQLERAGRNYTSSTTYKDLSPDFRAPLGFIQRVDIRQIEHYEGYSWHPENGRILSFGPGVNALVDWDHRGRLQDWALSPEFKVELGGQTEFKVSHMAAFELFQQIGFRKDNSEIAFSSSWQHRAGISASYLRGTGVNYTPAEDLAPFLGREQQGNLTLTLWPSKRVRLDETYIYSALHTMAERLPPGSALPEGVFNNHLLRSKANVQFTRALSLRTIVDYNALLSNDTLFNDQRFKRLTGNVLLTYMLNPGTALYVGYNNSHEDVMLDPTLPPYLRRTLSPTTLTGSEFFVKLSYLMRF